MVSGTFIALICCSLKDVNPIVFFHIGGYAGHLTMVSRTVSDLEAGNHVAVRVNGCLHVIAYAEAFVRFHQSRIRVG